jgi:MFS family permease
VNAESGAPPPDDRGLPDKKDDTDAVYQTTVIAFGNIVILAVVWGLLRWGYPEPREPPTLFTIAQVVISAVGCVTAIPEHVAAMVAQTWTEDPYEPGPQLKRWLSARPRVQPFVVFALAALVLASLTYLVWVTGLGIESPFVALAAAPAVFGPFVARKRRGVVVGLVAIVSVLLGVVAIWAPTSPCGRHECTSPQATASREPGRGVFFATTVTVLVIVGVISANKLETEKKTRVKLKNLETENAALRRGLPPAEPAS